MISNWNIDMFGSADCRRHAGVLVCETGESVLHRTHVYWRLVVCEVLTL
jgi:hypothetical protein